MWAKGQTEEKAGTTQDKFRQEMAKRTVINRTCKMYLNTSDDSSLVMQHFHGTDETIQEAQVQQEIEQNANQEVIDVEYEDEPEVVQAEDVEPLEQTEDEYEQMEQVLS